MDFCLFLEVPTKDLLGRLAGRRVCKGCGAVYHVQSKPAKKDGVCDLCGNAVVQRPDDSENVVSNRLEAYEKSTAPLRDYYRSNGNYVEIDGTGETDQVFARLTKALAVKQ